MEQHGRNASSRTTCASAMSESWSETVKGEGLESGIVNANGEELYSILGTCPIFPLAAVFYFFIYFFPFLFWPG